MSKIQGRFRRATLRSRWWKNQLAQLKHCFQCGGALSGRYVRAERKRRHVCVSCVTVTYTNPKVVAGCIPVMPNGKIVLLRRSIEPALGHWTFPAGYMELGETVMQAAARETQEEVNLDVRIGAQVGIFSYEDAGVVTIVFEGRVRAGQKPTPATECDDVMIVSDKEITWKKLAFRSTAHALKDWIRARKKKSRKSL